MRACSLLAGFALSIFAAAPALAVFADGATTVNATSFGGGVLTGAPDNGGAWLSNTSDPPVLVGSITWHFSGGLIDGAGTDIRLYDLGNAANETFNLALSTDGVSFTSIGNYNTTNTSFDIAGLFAGIFNYVRVTNSSITSSADFDAAEGFYEASAVGQTPLPAALPLFATGLGAFGLIAYRRKRKQA